MVHMMKRLVLIAILLGFPALEAVVLVRLSETLGWWVLAWVILAACAGIALIKEASYALVARLAAGLAQGRFSIAALTDSARTVLAGLLLIYPGVVSDLIAFTLLLLPGPRLAIEKSGRRDSGGALIEGEFRRTR
ncbi:MAG TPA: FxsA family protein [Usitatibacter sp.]|nr:FxsA family protein [Usitatibacter sp.]